MQIVDDGSGVIDCCISYAKVDQTKLTPVQETRHQDPEPKKYGPRGHTTKMSDYYPKQTLVPPRRLITPAEPPEWEPSFPIPESGGTIRVEGKLRSTFGERIVLMDKLGMCLSNITDCCRFMLVSTHRAVFYEG